jgi:hypothetical protein
MLLWQKWQVCPVAKPTTKARCTGQKCLGILTKSSGPRTVSTRMFFSVHDLKTKFNPGTPPLSSGFFV